MFVPQRQQSRAGRALHERARPSKAPMAVEMGQAIAFPSKQVGPSLLCKHVENCRYQRTYVTRRVTYIPLLRTSCCIFIFIHRSTSALTPTAARNSATEGGADEARSDQMEMLSGVRSGSSTGAPHGDPATSRLRVCDFPTRCSPSSNRPHVLRHARR